MMSVSEELKKLEKRQNKPKEPVWAGPCSDAPNGGVTQSMLQKFLSCRERFRIYVVEGLRTADQFNSRIEFGNLWHVCEEAFSSERAHFGEEVGTTLWEDNLKDYAQKLTRKYPLAVNEIDKWYNVIKKQFPIYRNYWSKHPDIQKRTPLLQEQVFDVPYTLPSGRVVRLRGKWDSVDLVGSGKNAGIWLMENKTKSEIRGEELVRQLSFDMQVMLYMTALTKYQKLEMKTPNSDFWRENQHLYPEQVDKPIAGVRYNVIRRPLSGGKGTIVRHKATKNKPEETREDYYNRLAEYIRKEPETYFMRWNVPITQGDINKFRNETLDPILENLCNWWDLIEDNCIDDAKYLEYGLHWRTPFGLHAPLMEGGSTDLDEYLDTKSEVGLQRITTLFGELE